MKTLRITAKDLRLLTRDRRALVVLLALPLVLIAVIGSSAGRLVERDAGHSAAAPESVPSVNIDTATKLAGGGDAEVPPEPGRVYRSIVPGYIVLFVFFIVNIMGRSFIQERELGTLQRLRMSPASDTAIMAGKTLPFLLVSVAQTGLLLLAGIWIFGMPAGERPGLLVPLVFCTSLAATTLGAAFAAFVKTDAQVSAWGNLIVLTTAGVSGCLIPRHWMPEASQQISLLTPHAWALLGYREILVSAEPRVVQVAVSCTVLLAFTAVFLFIGYTGFRKSSAGDAGS